MNTKKRKEKKAQTQQDLISMRMYTKSPPAKERKKNNGAETAAAIPFKWHEENF